MKLIIKISLLSLVLVSFSTQSFSQIAKPFKLRHQGYVNGDMTMIANSIVNTSEKKDNANIPYNDRTIKGNLNDECYMKYVDVDNDNSTFSSSSADLILDNKKNKKIVYAGLYWSATYIYNSGKLSRAKKFKAKDSNRDEFNVIKLKLPNQERYSTIEGELLYDGIEDEEFKESAPYAMYADITSLVTNSKDQFGTYTVANIKSTNGRISGGISAGWSIFFIYEDQSMTRKFITCYDGFAGITDTSLDIEFAGFQTLPQGNVKAKLACAALEGDFKLKGDQILFKSSQNNDFVQLYNSLRDKTNIFNSSITIDDTMFEHRNPKSSNTLGYDSFIMTIDNLDNSIIGNNTKEATLRLKTYGDRYFMFFTAFNVEVTMPKTIIIEDITNSIVDSSNEHIESSLLEKTSFTKDNSSEKPDKNREEILDDFANTLIKNTEAIKIAENKIITSENEETTSVNNTKNIKIAENNTSIKNAKTEIITNGIESVTTKKSTRLMAIESQSVLIPSVIEAYYIIANVFAVPSNATRFIAKLKKKGITANYFINPINNYRYVYVSSHANFNEASNYYESDLDGKYKDALWIMTVNKQNNSSYAFNPNSSKETKLKNVVDKKLHVLKIEILYKEDNYSIS